MTIQWQSGSHGAPTHANVGRSLGFSYLQWDEMKLQMLYYPFQQFLYPIQSNGILADPMYVPHLCVLSNFPLTTNLQMSMPSSMTNSTNYLKRQRTTLLYMWNTKNKTEETNPCQGATSLSPWNISLWQILDWIAMRWVELSWISQRKKWIIGPV